MTPKPREYQMWANNSADDPTFDHLIEQAELDELWAATAPDEPAARGRQEDRVYTDPQEDPPEASQR